MNIYRCVIDSQKQVYDGDTIKDVFIKGVSDVSVRRFRARAIANTLAETLPS